MDAFSVVLEGFWRPLGCLWGSFADPRGALGASWGHIWDQVLKEDLPNSRKSVAGAPKRWPGEPKKPSDGREKEAKRRVNETLNTTKVSEKEK